MHRHVSSKPKRTTGKSLWHQMNSILSNKIRTQLSSTCYSHSFNFCASGLQPLSSAFLQFSHNHSETPYKQFKVPLDLAFHTKWTLVATLHPYILVHQNSVFMIVMKPNFGCCQHFYQTRILEHIKCMHEHELVSSKCLIDLIVHWKRNTYDTVVPTR